VRTPDTSDEEEDEEEEEEETPSESDEDEEGNQYLKHHGKWYKRSGGPGT
jgi:hypothetical protein